MKCRMCRCLYGISDVGAWCLKKANEKHRVYVGREYQHGEYSYAAGLCILCHDEQKRRDAELDALLSPDNEPPF